MLTADYPSEFSVFLVSTLTNDSQIADRIYGKHGTIDFDGCRSCGPTATSPKNSRQANGGQAEAKLEPEPRRDMVGNFVDVSAAVGRCTATSSWAPPRWSRSSWPSNRTGKEDDALGLRERKGD